MGIPVCIALNMIDVAKKRGIKVDAQKLSSLLGVPVTPTVARSGRGKKELMDNASQIIRDHHQLTPLKISYGADIDPVLSEMEKEIVDGHFLTDTYQARWIALKYLESDEQIIDKGQKVNLDLSNRLREMVRKVSRHLQNTLDTYPEAMIADQRYGHIKSILKHGVIHHKYDRNRLYSSDRIDKVLTNRFVGPLIMLAVIVGLYHFTFTYSGKFFWLAGVNPVGRPAGGVTEIADRIGNH